MRVDGASERAAELRRPRSPAIWWSVGIAALLGDVGVAALSYHGPDDPIVLGSYIPRSWHLAGLLTMLGLAALVVGSSFRVAAQNRGQAEPRALWRRVAVVSTTLVALLVSTVALLVIGLAAAVTSYHVLQPAGPQGCRIVVAEDTFLLLGSGRVFVLPAGSHRPRQVTTFSTDDGYRPISLNTYRLSWDGPTASLSLWGSASAPVSYEQVPLTCPS